MGSLYLSKPITEYYMPYFTTNTTCVVAGATPLTELFADTVIVYVPDGVTVEFGVGVAIGPGLPPPPPQPENASSRHKAEAQTAQRSHIFFRLRNPSVAAIRPANSNARNGDPGLRQW